MKSKNGNTGGFMKPIHHYVNILSRTAYPTSHDTNSKQADQLRLVMTDVVSQGRYGRSQRIKIAFHL